MAERRIKCEMECGIGAVFDRWYTRFSDEAGVAVRSLAKEEADSEVVG